MASTTVGTIELIAKIDTANYKRGASEIDQANKTIEKSTNDADKSTSSFGSSVGSLAKGALKAGAIALTAVGVASVVMGKNFVESASELQSLRASFESLTGSSGSASKVMAQLYEFGKTTAFTNNQIQTTARSFLAAGVSVEQLGKYMSQAGDIAGATGADLAQFTLPLTQAIARGKLQTQDFYQILNSGAGAFRKNLEDEVIKRGLGNLQDALSDGTVTTEVLISALETATKVGGFAFQGAIKQAQTYNGRLSNMQEAITNVGLAILGVDAITGEVKAGGVFDNISLAIQRTTEFLGQNKNAILDFINSAIKPFGDAFTFVAQAVQNAFAFFKPLFDYIKSNQQVMDVLVETVKVLGFILGGTLFIAIGLVIGAIAIMTGAIQGAINAFSGLGSSAIQAYGTIVNAFSNLPKFFSNLWGGIINLFGSVGSAIGNAIGGAFKAVINGIISYVESTINSIVGSINGVTKGIDDALPGDQSAFRVPSVRLPRLAEGGIVSSPTIAMIGEGGESEAVIPLSKLDKMLENSGGKGSEYNIGVINISSEVDGQRWLRRLSNDQEIVSNGLVPNQTYMETN